MEKIFYLDFSLDAQYIGYWNGIKVFLCQERIAFTKDDNVVIESSDLMPMISEQIEKIIKTLF